MSQNEIDQTKQNVINSLPEECRDVGQKFFDCLEVNAKDAQVSNFNEKQYETFMIETAVPKCLNEYNLEECLVKNQK